jgi:hypothetical protein
MRAESVASIPERRHWPRGGVARWQGQDIPSPFMLLASAHEFLGELRTSRMYANERTKCPILCGNSLPPRGNSAPFLSPHSSASGTASPCRIDIYRITVYVSTNTLTFCSCIQDLFARQLLQAGYEHGLDSIPSATESQKADIDET